MCDFLGLTTKLYTQYPKHKLSQEYKERFIQKDLQRLPIIFEKYNHVQENPIMLMWHENVSFMKNRAGAAGGNK